MAILKGHWFCRQDNHWQVIFRQHHLTGALVLTLSVFPSPPGVELNCTMLIDFKLVLPPASASTGIPVNFCTGYWFFLLISFLPPRHLYPLTLTVGKSSQPALPSPKFPVEHPPHR